LKIYSEKFLDKALVASIEHSELGLHRAGRGLVLDANILVRAGVGRSVRSLSVNYEDLADFYAPAAASQAGGRTVRRFICGAVYSGLLAGQ